MTSPTAARLTAPGRGAVATIRVRDLGTLLDGNDSSFRAANGRPLSEQPVNRIAFGQWGRDPAEDVVVCRTDERSVEIHCHGGAAAVGRILHDLEERGCAAVDWREQTASTFEAELLETVARATTVRTATIALEQYNGALRDAIDDVRRMVDADAARAAIGELLRWAEFGRHLVEPWSVVLTGRPNVGKSSLINALLGYTRSIVYDQPGTTRDVVTAETAFDGWPVRLADTAGIRERSESLEEAGIERARRALLDADCRVVLVDVSEATEDEDRRLLAAWPEAIVVAHKCDRPNVWGDELPPGAVHVSSVTGEGVDALIAAIVARLVPEVPPAGAAIPVTVRQRELLERASDAAAVGDSKAILEEFA